VRTGPSLRLPLLREIVNWGGHMSSEVVVYGEPPSKPESKTVRAAEGDRGRDWQLALTFLCLVLALYVGLGYATYVIARSLF
jgi:hypothetical protein